MDGLLFRMRAAVLWVAVAVANSGCTLLLLYAPGALEELLAGKVEGTTVDETTGFQLATFVIIPLVMAGVTLLVSDRVNVYVNLIAGLASGLLLAGAAVLEVLGGHFDGHVVMGALAAAPAFLIAGLALVEPRQRATTAAGGRPN